VANRNATLGRPLVSDRTRTFAPIITSSTDDVELPVAVTAPDSGAV